MGSSQKQVEAGSSVNQKMVTHIPIRDGKTQLNLMVTSVWARFVGKFLVDVDESNEKRDRQLESAYSQYDTGDEERCRGGDGSMVEKIPSRFEESKPVAVKHRRDSSTAGKDM